MPFIANFVGFTGGLLFDRLGPRTPVCLGSSGMTIGYCTLGMAISAHISPTWKFAVAALGSIVVGFCSVSLLDNIACMACSVSFPRNRAAIVGYLKAVLATAGGLWALLWAQVFRSYGLLPFLAVQAIASFSVGVVSPSSINVLPKEIRGPMDEEDYPKASFLVLFLVLLTVLDVVCSYQFSKGAMLSPLVGLVGVALQLAPFLVLFNQKGGKYDTDSQTPRAESKPVSKSGLPFHVAVRGMDFYLLWSCQFAIFGAGVATNQNLAAWPCLLWLVGVAEALILESAGHNNASSLGVALFALTSALSRVAAGILSDKYQSYFTRFNWLTAARLACLEKQLGSSRLEPAVR